MKPEKRTGRIGEVIEETARSRNFITIRNLSGHLIGDYNLHAGKSIPNVKEIFSPKIKLYEIYAVEPFLTFSEAKGKVVEGKENFIFRATKWKKPKDKKEAKLYGHILKRFNKLPFSPRWLKDIMPLSEVLEKLFLLKRRGLIQSYPVLIEESGRPVSQFEHTVLIKEDGAQILT